MLVSLKLWGGGMSQSKDTNLDCHGENQPNDIFSNCFAVDISRAFKGKPPVLL